MPKAKQATAAKRVIQEQIQGMQNINQNTAQ
jgi:hypothetical protein